VIDFDEAELAEDAGDAPEAGDDDEAPKRGRAKKDKDPCLDNFS